MNILTMVNYVFLCGFNDKITIVRVRFMQGYFTEKISIFHWELTMRDDSLVAF